MNTEIKENEKKKDELTKKLESVKTEEEKKQIQEEVKKVENNISTAKNEVQQVTSQKAEVAKKVENTSVASNKRGTTTNNTSAAASSKPANTSKPTKASKPAKPAEAKPIKPVKAKPSAPIAPSKPVETVKPSKPSKPSQPSKPVVTVVKTDKTTYTENKDTVAFSIETVNDNSQPVGTSGVSRSGQNGYTVYTYEKTITYYSDGTTKDNIREVSRDVVAPVNQVNWVGTYEALKPSGYLNNAEAERAALAINEARVANGGTAASYRISSDAQMIYEELWSKYGLDHWGYPAECIGYAGNGSTTVQGWLSDGHRASIIENTNNFVVSCFTDSDGVNWFLYYIE